MFRSDSRNGGIGGVILRPESLSVQVFFLGLGGTFGPSESYKEANAYYWEHGDTGSQVIFRSLSHFALVGFSHRPAGLSPGNSPGLGPGVVYGLSPFVVPSLSLAISLPWRLRRPGRLQSAS